MSNRLCLPLRSNHSVAVIGIERSNGRYVVLRVDGCAKLLRVVAVNVFALCAMGLSGHTFEPWRDRCFAFPHGSAAEAAASVLPKPFAPRPVSPSWLQV